nr:MAG: hypothetical protein [Bacteriophage sp.]
MTNSHDDRRSRARTETDSDSHDDMTETASDITRDDRDEIVITKGYESYNEKLEEKVKEKL